MYKVKNLYSRIRQALAQFGGGGVGLCCVDIFLGGVLSFQVYSIIKTRSFTTSHSLWGMACHETIKSKRLTLRNCCNELNDNNNLWPCPSHGL